MAKLFDVIDNKFFSVLSAPNRELYLDSIFEIYLIKKPELKAIVAGANAVTYNGGAPMRITALSNMLFEQHNLGVPHLGGFEYFAYDKQDKSLYDRYNRIKGQGK